MVKGIKGKGNYFILTNKMQMRDFIRRMEQLVFVTLNTFFNAIRITPLKM